MTYKTRKHIWPVALMSLAVFGVLAAVLALSAVQTPAAQAHNCDEAANLQAQAECIRDHVALGLPGDQPDPAHPANGSNMTALPTAPASAGSLDIQLAYANGMVTVSWDAVTGASEYLVQYRQCTADDCAGDWMSMVVTGTSHTIPSTSLDTSMPHQVVVTAQAADDTVLSQSDSQLVCPSPAPREFQISALDNGARLSWEDPNDYHNSEVLGYQIERVAYLQDGSNPILQNTGDAMIYVGVDDAVTQETWDLGLSYGTTYTYRVRAHMRITNPDGSTVTGYGLWSERETVITADSGGRLEPLLAPPSAPTNVMANADCDEQITITWAAPADFGKVPAEFPGCSTCTNLTPPHIGGTNAGIVIQPGTAQIDGYMVERKVGAGEWQVVAANTTDMSYTDTSSLMYGYTYQYRVKAMNNARLYGPSGMVSETLMTPPEAQVPLSPDADLHADDSSKVLFTWDPPPGSWRSIGDIGEGNQSMSMKYHVERRLEGTPNSDWVRLTVDADGNDAPRVHQYLDNESKEEAIRNIQTQGYEDEPEESGSYKYRVAALLDNCQLSRWAVTAREVVVSLEPGQPTGLEAVAAGQSQINLSWTAPADAGGTPIVGYKIEYAVPGDWASVVDNTNSTDTTYSHTGLMASTTYSYRVSAINGTHTGEPSATDMATTTAALILGTPSITAASNAAGSATIALAPAANATKHFVWAFRVGGTDNATDGMWSNEAAGDATSVTMTGLTSGESYWFIAIAGRGDGDQTEWSGWSSWTAATPIQ